jgi:dipeptidyl aminopeptidase/acylaminoacyl peptidase
LLRSIIASFCIVGLSAPVISMAQNRAPAGNAQPRQGERAANRQNGAAQVELIPRSVLFGNPDRAAGRISPDGRHISFLAPLEGVLNVWVAPVDKIGDARPITRDTGRGIRSYFWAYTNEHILYIQDKDGDENWRVYAVNVGTDEVKDLTPFDNVAARIQEVSDKTPDQILVGLNDRNAQLHDIHRVNIRTGERELVQQNDGFVGFLTDDDYNVRLAVSFRPDGSLQFFKRDEQAERGFAPWQTVPATDALTTSPMGFDREGRTLYMRESRDRNTAALVAMNLESGETTTLAEHDRADLAGMVMHPTRKTPQAASFNYDRVQWKVLDEAIKADLDYLRTVADGEINITSRTLDDSIWTVAFIVDDGPVRTYLYRRGGGDGENRRAELLFTNRKDLEGLPLAKMRPTIITSRDGLELVSYLTLPVGASAGARPERPLPMVLTVHGGPWARDDWGFNPYHQWLANRGYAVLSVNFRGSTGFGKEFINAGNGEWAGKMHDDLIDAVDWAIKQKIADPEKVAIMGGSYGGYATLVGLTFTPEKFACGVSIVGPSSLVTLMENVPPYWMPLLPQLTTRVGDHRTPEGRAFLESRSPLNFVERIQRPLLIGQGANDPRVKQLESDQIVAAMQEKNIPVVYVLFPDEGHGFARPENSMAFNAVTEVFLAEHLGGRFEPIGEDFKGSTIQVPAGLDDVPAVSTALEAGESPTSDN